MMGFLHATHGRDDLSANLVLAMLGELSAAIEAMRHEVAKHRAERQAPPPVLQPGEAGAAIEELSNRQRQVLAGVVRGSANKVIAWELGLSVRTVEAYRAQLFDRLGARNAADAIRLALAAGFDRPQELHGRNCARPPA